MTVKLGNPVFDLSIKNAELISAFFSTDPVNKSVHIK